MDRKTLLMSGSLSGARLAKMTRMSVCKYTRPDLEEANLKEEQHQREGAGGGGGRAEV